MSGRRAMAERIAADFRLVGERLRSLPPVVHHEWIADPGELSWFAGDIFQSVASGASIFLRRVPDDPHIFDQIHAEVRLFWNEAGCSPEPGVHRAIIWCERGPRSFGRNKPMIGQGGRFLHASSIGALCDDLVERLGTAIEAWSNRRPEVPADA